LKDSRNLSDYLDIWGFEKDLTLFTDASLGFGFELNPIDVSMWSDDEKNSFSDRLSHFLNGLPEGISFQIVYDIVKDSEEAISGHLKLVDPMASTISKSLASTRVEKLKALNANQAMPKFRVFLFVRRPNEEKVLDRASLFSKAKKHFDLIESRLQSGIDGTNKLRANLKNQLEGLGLSCRGILPRELAEILYLQWNPTRGVELGQYDPDNLRDSLLFSNVEVEKDHFQIGRKKFRVLSLKTLPEQSYSGMMHVIRDLPFGSRAYLSCHVPQQMKEIEKLERSRRIAFSLVAGRRNEVSDLESQAKLQDIETLLSQMIADGEKVFNVSLQVLIDGATEAELDAKATEVLSCMRALSGAEGLEETLAGFSIFCDLSIPNATARERVKKVKTSNLRDLLPIYGTWAGHTTPAILLRNTDGALVSLDVFSSDHTNYNMLISGASGSGKSYLANTLILQMLKSRPQVFFVDIGGSYRKLCENLDGQYLGLGADTDLAINPFDLNEGETEPSPEKVKFLVGLVELMTREDGDTHLPRLHRAEIEEAIFSLYKKSPAPVLSQLQAILAAHPDAEIKRYARVLMPWCGSTAFGKFVDRPTTVKLTSDLVAFDLKGLESYADLQAVCLFIITDFIWRSVQKERTRQKFVVFDECWQLLKSQAGAAFIESVYRTFRKYNASAVAISQSIEDFAGSSVSSAILSNCSIKWILLQQNINEDRFKELLHLNDNEIAVLQSLHQKKGEYSQGFLMAQNRHTLVMIESTPLEYWISTTDPRDLTKVDELEATKLHTKPEILELLAKRYPNGVAHSERK
jgi:conjugal transfer ATP-binding protein TraC